MTFISCEDVQKDNYKTENFKEGIIKTVSVEINKGTELKEYVSDSNIINSPSQIELNNASKI